VQKKDGRRYPRSEETRAKMCASWTPERRAKKSASMSGENNPAKRPEVRANLKAAWTPERRVEKSKAMSGRDNPMKQPEARAKMSIAMTGRVFSEKHRAKISVAMTGKILSEEHKVKIGVAITGRTRSEETKAKISAGNIGKTHTEESKAKMSEAKIGKTLSEQHKAKMSAAKTGEKNPSWRGGASYLPYCHLFNEELKAHTRNLYDRTCTVCGKSALQNISKDGKWLGRLDIDHLDENKMQGCDDWKWRLTVLCHSCHSRMNRQENHTLLQLLLLKNKRHQTNFLLGGRLKQQ
jgi:hypothetical protein